MNNTNNFLLSFILDSIIKTIIILIIFNSYLFFYYGPKFEDGIKKLFPYKNQNTSIKKNMKMSSSKDTLLVYLFIICFLLFALISYYITLKKIHFKYTNDHTGWIDIIFNGVFTLYIVHYSLENYSLNIYEILKKKILDKYLYNIKT